MAMLTCCLLWAQFPFQL